MNQRASRVPPTYKLLVAEADAKWNRLGLRRALPALPGVAPAGHRTRLRCVFGVVEVGGPPRRPDGRARPARSASDARRYFLSYSVFVLVL